MVASLQSYTSRFLLLNAAGLVAVGHFSLSLKVASAISLVVNSFRTAWLPHAMQLIGTKGADSNYARVLELYLFLLCGVCCIVGALGECLLAVLAPTSYRGAGSLVGIVAMGFLWEGTLDILGMGLCVARKTYLVFFGVLLGGIANVLIVASTATGLGALAAAIGLFTGHMVSAATITLIAQRTYRIPFNERALLCFFLLTGFLPACFYLINTYCGKSFILSGSINVLVALAGIITAGCTLLTRGNRKWLMLCMTKLWRRFAILWQ